MHVRGCIVETLEDRRRVRVRRCATLAALGAALLAACGGAEAPSTFQGNVGAGGSGATGAATTGSLTTGTSGTGSITPIVPEGGSAGSGGSSDGGKIVGVLPPDYTKSEAGGYKLGPAITGAGVMDTGLLPGVCNEIVGVVRDFKGNNVTGGHPDFEHYNGGGTKGMVADTLGPDGKPVYTGVCEAATPPAAACPSGQMTNGKAIFDQWYRFTEGVNKPYLAYFFFQAAPGQSIITFNSQFFFPVDNAGWQAPGVAGGDTAQNGNDNRPHNFAFTTEVHTKFKYLGGETFTFEGDDDLWIFMNGKLAIDLGGLHSSLTSTVDLDASAGALGLTKGNTYPLDLISRRKAHDGVALPGRHDAVPGRLRFDSPRRAEVALDPEILTTPWPAAYPRDTADPRSTRVAEWNATRVFFLASPWAASCSRPVRPTSTTCGRVRGEDPEW